MNTQIYLWIEPMVMNHKRCSEKVYFNCTIDGNYSKLEPKELEDIIGGKNMDNIMDYANISSNWDYGVISAKATRQSESIEILDSPEKIAKDKEKKELDKKIESEKRVVEKAKKTLENKIVKIVSNKKEIELTKSNVQIQDNGIIEVSLPSLQVKETINFPDIWDTLEKEFIGKIKEGDKVTLTDDFGNKLFEIIGGSFLNVGIADMKVYDSKKMPKKPSMFNWSEGLKGGLFVRDDGSMHVGDLKRTFFFIIHTNNLLKSSLKLKKPLNELTSQKLLENKNISKK
jgi:hypothetical protein